MVLFRRRRGGWYGAAPSVWSTDSYRLVGAAAMISTVYPWEMRVSSWWFGLLKVQGFYHDDNFRPEVTIETMNEFVRMVRMMRFCWVCGRYGGGKTTLALKLADRLIRGKCVSKIAVNMPLDIDVPYTLTWDERELMELRDTVLLLDEAGQFLDDGNRKVLKQWFSYLRKRNQIVLMPSVMPVVRYATSFRAQRLFNGMQMGVPVWIYRWTMKLFDSSDKGLFMWWNPSEIFGVFDTDYEPNGSWYIYDFSNESIEQDDDDRQLGAITDPTDDPDAREESEFAYQGETT